MLREHRVPMLRAQAAARPTRRPLLKATAALIRQGVDVVVYGYLAVVWAHSLFGVAVEILGRWVYGEGSAAEAIGAAIRADFRLVMVRLFPAAFPLTLMRLLKRVDFELKEQEKREKEEREKESNEQLPKRNRAQLPLPKGFPLIPLYMSSYFVQLLCLAIMMKDSGEGERGYLMRRVGSVLYDVACFGLAVSTGFLAQNLLILVTAPRVKDSYDLMQ